MAIKNVLFKAAGMLALVSLVNKLLGFSREASLAAVFGATSSMDAYLVGQTIPVMIFSLIGAALGTTFIPVFTQIRQEKGKDASINTANSVINSSLLLSVLLTICGILSARFLVHLMAPGFTGLAYESSVQLTKIMFPMVPLTLLAGVVGGILETDGNFAARGFVSLISNIAIVYATLQFGARFGINVVGIATVIGPLFQTTILLLIAFRTGFTWRPVMNLRDPGLIKIFALSVPVLIGSSVIQLGTMVDRILASYLPEGSVSALNYANRLMTLAHNVFGVAISTVMYPTLSRLASMNDWINFRRSFSKSISMTYYITVPVAVAMGILRFPIIKLVFQRGAFDDRATHETAFALLFFTLAVAIYSLRELASRAFYACQDTMTPMIVGSVSILIDVSLNFALVRPLRQGGLALSTSIGGAFSALVMLLLLRRKMEELDGGIRVDIRKVFHNINGSSLIGSLFRVVIASGVMGIVLWVVYNRLEGILTSQSMAIQILRLAVTSICGMVVYFVLTLLLQVNEAKFVSAAIFKMLPNHAAIEE